MTSRPEHVLHINWTRCDGRGLCTELLPELLSRDRWGYPVPVDDDTIERTNIPIADHRLAAAKDAVRLCPTLALTLRRPQP